MYMILRDLRALPCFEFSRLQCLLLLLSLGSLAGCSALKPVNLLNALVPSSGFTLQEGIVYGDDKRQKLDIYQPVTPASDTHTIIFVYGGAWRQGNREEYEFVGQALADAGHTVIIPDYRLYPAVSYPVFITDVAEAITAVAAHGEQWLGYPVKQVVLMGHSSGAHSAAMLASDPRWLEDSGVTPSALVAISGPYDLPLDHPDVEPVFHNVSGADEARPVALVTSKHPPTLLIHGEDDERVLPFHTRNYSAALMTAGVPVEVQWLKDTSHVAAIAGIAAPLDTANRNRERITEFLDSIVVRKAAAFPDD